MALAQTGWQRLVVAGGAVGRSVGGAGVVLPRPAVPQRVPVVDLVLGHGAEGSVAGDRPV